MNITLEIRPETEAALRRRARSSGRGLEAFAVDLLEDALHLPLPETAGLTGRALIDASAKVRGLFTDEEVDTMFSREPTTERPVSFE
jgi:hypothetical protein